MYSKVAAGVVSGLLAAVLCGMFWSTMNMTLPVDHTQPQALMMHSLGPQEAFYRWLFKLIESAILGAFYGGLIGALAYDGRQALASGLSFGLACWVLGPVLIMPLIVGLPAASTLLYADLRVFAVIGFFEYIAFGALLASFFMLLYAPLRRLPLIERTARPGRSRPLVMR